MCPALGMFKRGDVCGKGGYFFCLRKWGGGGTMCITGEQWRGVRAPAEPEEMKGNDMRNLLTIVIATAIGCSMQAVTTSWSTAAYREKTEVPSDFRITAGREGTIAIIANMTEAATVGGGNSTSPGNGTVISFGDDTKYVRVSTWAGKWHASFEGVSTGAATSNNPVVEEGQAVIGISMKRDGANFSKLEVSVNGTVFFSLTEPTTGLGEFWMYKYVIGQNMQEGSLDNNLFKSTDDIRLFLSDTYMTPAQIAALPEPTALALLALGVAGLALRRHVA